MVTEEWTIDGETIKKWLRANVIPLFCTWYGVALLVLVVFNSKWLPSIWKKWANHHNATVQNQQRQRLTKHTEDGEDIGLIAAEDVPDSMEDHPLFQPVVINTNVPQSEMDLNVYESSSTFFYDLEVSRIKLMGQIIAPAWPMDDMQIEYKSRDGKEKKGKVKGRPALILGATHTSFRRELSPHAVYTIESRILGWDSRWIYVGSWFQSKNSSKKKLYATSLSKYIIKKGRITVRPEQFFIECGWISTQAEDERRAEEMTGNEKVLLWSEFGTLKENGVHVIQTWNEAIVFMEQEYED